MWFFKTDRIDRPSQFRRTRTPRVIQMEAVECGVASLSIILGYYGKFLPLEVLRLDCGVSRDGSSALNLLRAAEKYGLKGSGYKKSMEDLFESSFPSILFWEYRHFLVLEGFGRNKVYLNDPASGPRTISYEEFEEKYSGVCLEFEKTENFAPGGSPPPLISELYRRLKRVMNPIYFIWVLTICLLLPGFALPAFLRVLIDTFFQKNFIPWKGLFLSALFLTALFSASLIWLRSYILNRLNAKLSILFSSQFFMHLLQLPISFYSQRYAGEIAFRITLNDAVTDTLTGSILFSAMDLLVIVAFGIAMFFFDPWISLIGWGVGISSLILMILIYKSRENAYARLQQDVARSIGTSIGGLQNIETIKARGGETDFFSTWSGYYTLNINAYQEIGKKDCILNTFPIFFQMIASALLLGLGSMRIIEGTLTIGTLMALQLLMINFLQPINRFVGLSQLIQNMKVNLDRLNDVLKNPVDPIYNVKKNDSGKIKLEGHLEFRDVTFGYANLSPPLIQNLNFTIKPGYRLAIVGATGSGKSTIAKLASRLFHPWSGQILYDGTPIEEIPRELLYNSIATVDQDIFLFAGTIRENLTLWNNKVPDDLLVEAAHDASIHEEIILRSGGYDAPIIEGGRNLSGGQRQRLEIARALLYRPSFLILDEATSSLDSKKEEEIFQQIKKRGCSVLMIAHRLSTVQDCDEIIVLDKGQVVQRGTHEQLKSVPGIYQTLTAAEAPG